MRVMIPVRCFLKIYFLIANKFRLAMKNLLLVLELCLLLNHFTHQKVNQLQEYERKKRVLYSPEAR